jgi:ribosomal protein S13
MSRPRKNIVDYFPHDCNQDMILDIIVGQYGNDGYVFFYRLRELLGRTDGHTYKCETQLELNYLLTQTVNDGEKVKAIINLLCELGAIDKEIWDNEQRIWWQSFVDLLDGVYDKRKNDKPTKNSFRSLNKGFRERNGVSDPGTGVSGIKNPQSKGIVKKTKIDESSDLHLLNDKDIAELKKVYNNVDVDHSYKRYLNNQKENGKSPTREGIELWLDGDVKNGYNLLPDKPKEYPFVCPVEGCDTIQISDSQNLWANCRKHEDGDKKLIME